MQAMPVVIKGRSTLATETVFLCLHDRNNYWQDKGPEAGRQDLRQNGKLSCW